MISVYDLEGNSLGQMEISSRVTELVSSNQSGDQGFLALDSTKAAYFSVAFNENSALVFTHKWQVTYAELEL